MTELKWEKTFIDDDYNRKNYLSQMSSLIENTEEEHVNEEFVQSISDNLVEDFMSCNMENTILSEKVTPEVQSKLVDLMDTISLVIVAVTVRLCIVKRSKIMPECNRLSTKESLYKVIRQFYDA